jgi:hypothetical protein
MEDGDYSKKELMGWLTNFVNKFREEYEKLDELEKSKIYYTINYSTPCQIEVFWINKPVEYQMIIFTHDATRKDMEIIINGPYESNEFLDNVESIIREPRWMKTIPADSYSPFRDAESCSDILADLLNNFFDLIKDGIFSKIEKERLRFVAFPYEGWCNFFVGNVGKLDYNRMVDEPIKKLKLRAKSPDEKCPACDETLLTGYGTFIYPPIWVGEKPRRTFKERVWGTGLFKFPSRKFDLVFNDAKVLVSSDGFIVILTKEEKDAINILNTIFGAALISGIKCFVARELEISKVQIDPESLGIWIMQIPRSPLMKYRDISETKFMFSIISEIPEERIKDVIQKAEKLYRDKNLMEQLIFLLEGHTRYENSEYSQSFIMNWLIIERDLSEIWKIFLNEKNMEKERKKKFTNPDYLGQTDTMIEILNLNKKIDDKKYEQLIRLKGKRNRFIHSGEQIDKGTSEELLNLAFNIVKDKVNNFLTVSSKSDG